MQYLVCAALLVGAFADQGFLAKESPTVVAQQPAAPVPAKPAAPVQQVARAPPRGYYQPTIMDQIKYYGNPLNWQGLFNMAVFKVRMFLNTYVTQILLYGGIALGIYLTLGRLIIWQLKNRKVVR